jgi:hypothetical protein
MKITPNYHVSPVGRGPVEAAAAKKPTPAADEVSFTGTEALQTALRAQPEVRPEKVAQARDLVALSTYPPPELLRKISNLLAVNLLESEKTEQ